MYADPHTNNYASSSKQTQGVVAHASNQSEWQEELGTVPETGWIEGVEGGVDGGLNLELWKAENLLG